ncbi:MAG TPA: hypothetical protein VKU62_05895, partial [Thermoanaerobaculia bacterium]|nr:hypothetical protein [Thermoanaerobaculia bacterium]
MRKLALLCILLLFVLPSDGATRRRRRRPVAPAPPAEVAVGNTLEERIASLMNSAVARNSEASLAVVELDSGRLIAERGMHA